MTTPDWHAKPTCSGVWIYATGTLFFRFGADLRSMKDLHIYAQEAWHGEAFIVGDWSALFRLSNAIKDAANNGSSEIEMMTNDGEGYRIMIKAVPADQMDKMRLPYTDADVGARSESGVPPWELFQVPPQNGATP